MNGERSDERPKPRKPADLKFPGLIYRQRGSQWVILWSPHSDVVRRGYSKTTFRLWPATALETAPPEPTREDWETISAACERHQAELLLWLHGGVARDPRAVYDGTIKSLIEVYQTDADSPYKNLRRAAIKTYDTHLRSLIDAVGGVHIAGLTFRDFKRWYREFGAANPDEAPDVEHLPRAAQMMHTLRRLMRFGKLMKLTGCADAAEILSDMEFSGSRRQRNEFMTYAHARAIIAEAEKNTPDRMPFGSIALAQAMMFDMGLRQKDVIGEWVSLHDPGVTDIVRGTWKWIIGARWEEIDANMIWTHRLSKSVRGQDNIMRSDAGKVEQFDLRAYPLVMDVLRHQVGTDIIQRSQLPVSGPIIICEITDQPWTQRNWRRWWRIIADDAGVPQNIQNRDSRAGAATEADTAGAPRERVQRTLGHSQAETTAGYQRDGMTIRNEIARLRAEKRH